MPHRVPRTAAALVALALILHFAPSARAENAKAAAVQRVGDDIRYLASDELEGRGPQTKGLELAAAHIETCFREAGLKGGGKDGSFRNPFTINVDNKVVKDSVQLVLTHGDTKLELAMGKDFQPLAAGGSGTVEAPLVFVGYGISAPKLKYDDYADIDVAGKIVVLIRREPQQGDEESVFKGKQTSQHAFIRTKLAAAKKAKAAAILMVNDPHSLQGDKPDALTGPNGFGSNGAGIPFFHITQARLNELLAATPIDVDGEQLDNLEAIAAHIDEQLKPVSQPLKWEAQLSNKFEKVTVKVTNVIGVLEGEGPLADQTVVIGAHYDHLGMGPFGSRRPKERAVHNGADDNATGSAAVMELARRFASAPQRPPRRMVFVGFTAEERGILGSNHYVANPPFPLEKTVAMINFDMIGMYGKQGVTLGGVATGKPFAKLLGRATEGMDVKVKQTKSIGGSDHIGFYRKKVPILFFHTGLTDLYHTPEDDFETIDVEGAVTTIDLAERMTREVVELDAAPEFVRAQPTNRRRPVVYLGVVPKFGQEGEGVVLMEVADGSPAAKAGLKAGDVIVQLDDKPVKAFNQLPPLLAKYKAGDKVTVHVRRGEDTQKLEVTLSGPPRRP